MEKAIVQISPSDAKALQLLGFHPETWVQKAVDAQVEAMSNQVVRAYIRAYFTDKSLKKEDLKLDRLDIVFDAIKRGLIEKKHISFVKFAAVEYPATIFDLDKGKYHVVDGKKSPHW